MTKPNRRIMNKVAMLEAQVLAMKNKIQELQQEKEDEADNVRHSEYVQTQRGETKGK